MTLDPDHGTCRTAAESTARRDHPPLPIDFPPPGCSFTYDASYLKPTLCASISSYLAHPWLCDITTNALQLLTERHTGATPVIRRCEHRRIEKSRCERPICRRCELLTICSKFHQPKLHSTPNHPYRTPMPPGSTPERYPRHHSRLKHRLLQLTIRRTAKRSQTSNRPPRGTTLSKFHVLWLCVLLHDPNRTRKVLTPTTDPDPRRQLPRQTRLFREIQSRSKKT